MQELPTNVLPINVSYVYVKLSEDDKRVSIDNPVKQAIKYPDTNFTIYVDKPSGGSFQLESKDAMPKNMKIVNVSDLFNEVKVSLLNKCQTKKEREEINFILRRLKIVYDESDKGAYAANVIKLLLNLKGCEMDGGMFVSDMGVNVADGCSNSHKQGYMPLNFDILRNEVNRVASNKTNEGYSYNSDLSEGERRSDIAKFNGSTLTYTSRSSDAMSIMRNIKDCFLVGYIPNEYFVPSLPHKDQDTSWGELFDILGKNQGHDVIKDDNFFQEMVRFTVQWDKIAVQHHKQGMYQDKAYGGVFGGGNDFKRFIIPNQHNLSHLTQAHQDVMICEKFEEDIQNMKMWALRLAAIMQKKGINNNFDNANFSNKENNTLSNNKMPECQKSKDGTYTYRVYPNGIQKDKTIEIAKLQENQQQQQVQILQQQDQISVQNANENANKIQPSIVNRVSQSFQK